MDFKFKSTSVIALVVCSVFSVTAVADETQKQGNHVDKLAQTWLQKIDSPIIKSVELGEQAAKWQQQKAQSLSKQQQDLGELYWTEYQIQKQQRYLASLKKDVAQLNQDIATLNNLSMQLEPQLEIWYAAIENQIAQDIPFDYQERKRRLGFLRSAMDNSELTVAEKFTRLMDVMLIEVAYGYGKQVSQDVITVDGEVLQVNLLRLGRLGWFYMTPDNKRQGWFDTRSRTWHTLSATERGDLDKAIAISANKKIAEIVNLPIKGQK
ncbi:DUF3450 domain-containing protein [Shewanella intestini]|uniref:DUF3450 domain-containing protein n=1 Tax=Shewanella intestini TaxID=2017544 RepID=A0ABS5HZ26_9GAMM|nr:MULTISPECIES: DUF3450 domain-containing protein [Shewanella]MBR9726906.1 DUF3450 domain-containing protein [Shewanella intestini]MRG34528.1 DUF3450 family protein [Shewanella sp. XMDDZSB0408]